MSLLAVFLSLVMFVQYSCWAPVVMAATINFSPTGSGGEGTFIGEVNVSRIGKMKLSNGVVAVNGNVVDVLVSGADLTQKKTVLSGVVYKSKVEGSGSNVKLQGQCFFTSGSGLVEIDDPNAEELIDLVDGGVVSGHITALNHEECEVETKSGKRRLAMAMVSKIRSPRAWAFTIPIALGAAVATGTAFSGSANQCTFNATMTTKVASGASKTSTSKASHDADAPKAQKPPKEPKQPGEGPNIAKIMIITGILLGVAAAIAVPIAVACGTSGGGRNNDAQNQAALTNYLILRQRAAQPPPSPPPSSGP